MLKIILTEHNKFSWDSLEHLDVETVQYKYEYLLEEVLGLDEDDIQEIQSNVNTTLETIENMVKRTHLLQRIYLYNHSLVSFDMYPRCRFDSALAGYAFMDRKTARDTYEEGYEEIFENTVKQRLEDMTSIINGDEELEEW